MPLNYKFLSAIVTTALILCAAAPHHGKPNKIPPVALSAESAAITLDGPCIGFSYRNTGSRRGLSLGLDDGALAATQTPWDMQREATALLCQAPGFDAGVGFLLGQHIEAGPIQPRRMSPPGIAWTSGGMGAEPDGGGRSRAGIRTSRTGRRGRFGWTDCRRFCWLR